MSDEKVDLLYQSKRSLFDGLNERNKVSKSERHRIVESMLEQVEQVEQNRAVASWKASKTTLMRNAEKDERWKTIVEVERRLYLLSERLPVRL